MSIEGQGHFLSLAQGPVHTKIQTDFLRNYCADLNQNFYREAPWPSGRASDSGARGRGFDPHSGRRFVSLSKIHLPPNKYW